MASNKKFWRRDCDKTCRCDGSNIFFKTEPKSTRRAQCLAAPTGIKPPRAPKFFCARPRALHFGIA